jgi:hypothetical protein
MRFGDISSFAIECEIFREHNFRSTEPFGHISMWAGGVRIGHFDDVVMLSPVADAFTAFGENPGRRGMQHVFPDNAGDAFKTAFEAIFGRDKRDPIQVKADYRKFNPFLVCPNGSEAFDGWIAILVEGTDSDRFIWKDPEGKVHEVGLESNQLNLVIRNFSQWLDSQSTKHNLPR